MNMTANPGNTPAVATRFDASKNVSRQLFHFEEIEQIAGRAR